ncbi:MULTISPECIES: DMT family transporter [Pseudomonas]|uniref:Transporter n=1 Tax=Pseudomonas putida TaxID=303 RepID=A0A1L7NDU6_PSEPU|nr:MULTISPECIES: DMT family transporter [Pseudomonas]EKT4448909.1 DMT family transporter [Pseudomonas putida]MBH3447581.1 DMT family transporter [Pseudomonas putida]MBP2083078.1 drug/metabolite transporter (DMT)-like permease [Pseudomonas sp. PvP089]MBP2091219.1 drug/metabolite transporter (DMT)-like permease [Pseudomonas sp. PvP088]MBP2222618.1 drug/metabolite transporter (DMT)-like permease [Pseudomonas putida]
MQPRDLAAYLFLAIAWGFSFLVLLKVVHAFGWVGAVSLRALIASGTLALLAALLGRPMRLRPLLVPLLVVGATTVAGQLIGMSYATPRIGTAMAAIFVATIPLFSMLIGRVWGLEKITLQGLAGLLLGIAGIAILVGFPARPIDDDFIHGCIASLLGAISAAYGSNYASLHLRGQDPWTVTGGAFLAGGLMTLPLLLVVPVPSVPQASDWLYLLISGAVMSATTYVLYFGLVARIGATRAISVEFVVTLVAVLVGAVFLNEALSLLQAAGGLVILLGCMLVLGLLPGRVRRLPS